MFSASKAALEKCKAGKATDVSAEDEWSGKIFALEEGFLQGNGLLWISASNKPVFTKIELFTTDDLTPAESNAPVESPTVTPSQVPSAAPSAPAAQIPTQTAIAAAPAKGDVVKDKNASYTVSDVKNKTVEYKAPASKTKTSAAIPATVKVNGVSYKVTSIAKNAFKNNKKLKKVTIGANITSIGANAFSGCKSLKNVVVKSKSLKKVGKNAFKGIQKKAVFKVPAKKLKAYKKLFGSKAGVKKSMKIKK